MLIGARQSIPYSFVSRRLATAMRNLLSHVCLVASKSICGISSGKLIVAGEDRDIVFTPSMKASILFRRHIWLYRLFPNDQLCPNFLGQCTECNNISFGLTSCFRTALCPNACTFIDGFLYFRIFQCLFENSITRL